MVESGRMTRSAEECEMSRSCQRAMFSKRDLGVAADDAGEAADLLAGDGVALVRHGAGALLLFAEKNSSASRTSVRCRWRIFEGDLVERGAEDGERGDVGGVAVALEDLRGDGGGLEAELGADGCFVLGLEVAEGADGAGELADAQVFGGGVEAGEVALHLGVPEQELEAEGGGLGVDAVGAADGGRVLELEGALRRVRGGGGCPARMIAEASRELRAPARCRRRRWR
jgi:hypothetical protein